MGTAANIRSTQTNQLIALHLGGFPLTLVVAPLRSDCPPHHLIAASSRLISAMRQTFERSREALIRQNGSLAERAANGVVKRTAAKAKWVGVVPIAQNHERRVGSFISMTPDGRWARHPELSRRPAFCRGL
jgi:hypothetical protein